jgi:hypothetical protein
VRLMNVREGDRLAAIAILEPTQNGGGTEPELLSDAPIATDESEGAAAALPAEADEVEGTADVEGADTEDAEDTDEVADTEQDEDAD